MPEASATPRSRTPKPFGGTAKTRPSGRRRSKYNAEPVHRDGLRFDSKKEARRWGELRALEAAGLIEALRRQVRYPLRVNGRLVARYVADFVYVEGGRLVVEDAKGFRTDVYKLKRKLFRACYGLDITEV